MHVLTSESKCFLCTTDLWFLYKRDTNVEKVNPLLSFKKKPPLCTVKYQMIQYIFCMQVSSKSNNLSFYRFQSPLFIFLFLFSSSMSKHSTKHFKPRYTYTYTVYFHSNLSNQQSKKVWKIKMRRNKLFLVR